MRLWTLHPRYLDAKGLVAVWREGLLAQKVLQGETKGYRHHPQLDRFKQHPDPVAAIATYLQAVHAEAQRRGYRFDVNKIAPRRTITPIPVTIGQLHYEWGHLQGKLRQRDPARCQTLAESEQPEPHPLFIVVAGEVEPWEIRRE